jgi:UDP-glucuronate 4-epimerase
VPITYADVAKAERLLGYSPKVPIREGLRRFVAWYREARRPVAP